jgi:predicted DCC family thiol-disulfide oxidoreductase YuxK
MKSVMLYDGKCVLCRQSKRLIKFLDWCNNIETLDAQAWEIVSNRYPHLNQMELLGEIHVVKSDGSVKVGFFAVRYLMRFLPSLWMILPLMYLPLMNWIGPRVYRWVARRRYTLNRWFGAPTCDETMCKI